MAHKKAAGSKARQGGNVRGKRLGMKVSSGEMVKPGDILVRQIGTRLHPGQGVGQGRDFTLFATEKGTVSFKIRQGSKFIMVSSAEGITKKKMEVEKNG